MIENFKVGQKFVAIGGGTGLSTLLRGLKYYVPNTGCIERGPEYWIDQLTAIVTVTDDGGSSGQLRSELNVLPPGDIRNCMVALAEDEALMTQLFKFRFKGDGHLKGHSFGNLFLTAMTEVVGDFLEAIRLASEVLAIKGRIFPATIDDVRLGAELANGLSVRGETNITGKRSKIENLWLEPAQPSALPEAIDAIREADIITIGPGSLFTSILPNLLVPGIASAIASSKAKKIFVCNVMTQPGETDNFNAMDHLLTVSRYAPRIHFDAMLVNSTPLTPEQYHHYASQGSYPVMSSRTEKVSTYIPKSINGRMISVYHCDLLDEAAPARHKPEKIATRIAELALPKTMRMAKSA
jgi:uncharacterized cofD-like protein